VCEEEKYSRVGGNAVVRHGCIQFSHLVCALIRQISIEEAKTRKAVLRN
jgi:hypothetical protein